MKYIMLDDSVLDIDSWFPQSAIDEIVQVLVELDDKDDKDDNS